MIFEQIPLGGMQNFSYLIGDERSKESAVVDPGWEINKILNIAKEYGLNIGLILVTHTDYDHINGVKDIVNATNAVVYVHKEEESEIKNLGINKIKALNDNDEFFIGKIKVKVLHTPGHTPGSVCYLVENKLLTGDTLFVENIGRTDGVMASSKKMKTSLERLKKLDENIEVYPGHDYGSRKSSTIGHEKRNNYYLSQ